jgi:hypothetical protein
MSPSAGSATRGPYPFRTEISQMAANIARSLHELLDPVQRRLSPFPIALGGLFLDEPSYESFDETGGFIPRKRKQLFQVMSSWTCGGSPRVRSVLSTGCSGAMYG